MRLQERHSPPPSKGERGAPGLLIQRKRLLRITELACVRKPDGIKFFGVILKKLQKLLGSVLNRTQLFCPGEEEQDVGHGWGVRGKKGGLRATAAAGGLGAALGAAARLKRGVAPQGQLAFPKGHVLVEGGFQQAGLLKDLQDPGLLGPGWQEVVVLRRVHLEVKEQGGLLGGESSEAAAGPVRGCRAVEGSWRSKERREAGWVWSVLWCIGFVVWLSF